MDEIIFFGSLAERALKKITVMALIFDDTSYFNHTHISFDAIWEYMFFYELIVCMERKLFHFVNRIHSMMAAYI
jgi:hypothetical protein